jgi:hypothetical protein
MGGGQVKTARRNLWLREESDRLLERHHRNTGFRIGDIVSDCLELVLSKKRGVLEVGRPKAAAQATPEGGAKPAVPDSAA